VREGSAEHRVAVVLFDNETGLAEWDRRAQGLTDAAVARLTREPDLAVIGNAAVLRTSRPFRDIGAIRDALDADFLVVGQVQRVDAAVVVRAHLIRGRDQAHVWFDTIPMTADEATLQRDVSERIGSAVRTSADRS
jgi:TolB-like protein